MVAVKMVAVRWWQFKIPAVFLQLTLSFWGLVSKPFFGFLLRREIVVSCKQWRHPNIVLFKMLLSLIVLSQSGCPCTRSYPAFPLYLSRLFCYSGYMNCLIWYLMYIMVTNQMIYKCVPTSQASHTQSVALRSGLYRSAVQIRTVQSGSWDQVERVGRFHEANRWADGPKEKPLSPPLSKSNTL